MTPASGGRRRLAGASGKVMVVAGVACALALAGCSSHSPSAGHPTAAVGSAGNGTGASTAPKATDPSNPNGSAVTVNITPNAAAHANPITPVVVTATNGTLESVQLTNPKEKLAVTGTYAPGKTSWQTSEVLGYGKQYNIVVTAKDSAGKARTVTSTVTTINPTTAYPSVVPPPQATDIGVGMPLAVRFDQPIQDRAAVQKMLSVTATPAQAGAWYWLSDKEVDYRPETYWQAHSRITLHINIYGKDLGGGIYGQTDRTINYTVHDSWIAYADGNSETMTIKQNGVTVKQMPISMGKQATPTHLGIHVISQKDKEYTMNSCSYGVCSGPQSYIAKEYYAERISDDGEFVHENPDSVSHQGVNNVSHGCINLNEANAQWFFAHFGVGDVVDVVNSGGPQLPLTDRIGVWSVKWPTWQAGNAST